VPVDVRRPGSQPFGITARLDRRTRWQADGVFFDDIADVGDPVAGCALEAGRMDTQLAVAAE